MKNWPSHFPIRYSSMSSSLASQATSVALPQRQHEPWNYTRRQIDGQEAANKKLTGKDIAEHNNKGSCWIILHGKAYDVTEFLSEHRGGPQQLIMKYAGKDAMEGFEAIHPPEILDEGVLPAT